MKLHAGDLISLMAIDVPNSERVLVAHVSRFWLNRVDDDRQFLVFLYRTENGSMSSSWIHPFGIPALLSKPSVVDPNCTSPSMCLTKGTLPDGQLYYVYRLLLYADDFNPRSRYYPRGSVGGVYMSPLGLHIRSRRSQTSIRTLSLTPTGVSTNFVLDYISPDSVNGCINGFQ